MLTMPTFSKYVHIIAAIAACVLLTPSPASSQSLKPSRSSLNNQIRQARAHDYTYLTSPTAVKRFVAAGYLVRVRPNRDFELAGVSFPYARPEVRTFVERLGRQHREACGRKLVVTSLTRPKSHQPRNASAKSVHPTGMALDLRRGATSACRRFLDSALLQLEGQGVLEATWERWPPHYHVALFPKPYLAMLEARYDDAPIKHADPRPALVLHRVARGDNLWRIAKRYRTGVDRIRAVNRLRGSTIRPGQVLKIPAD